MISNEHELCRAVKALPCTGEPRFRNELDVYTVDVYRVDMIGKLEETILLAVLRAGPNAVPSAVHDVMVDARAPSAPEPAFGAVYTTLNRMAAKKMLTVGSTVDSKGRERRTFTITASGRAALDESLHTIRVLGSTLGGAFA